MQGKLVLIDGHSILHRAYYGIPDLTNSEGLHTNAVYGFLNIMFKVLDEEQPDYLAVAFDLPAPTFRHKMYDAYKGTRKPMDPELRQQVPLIRELLAAMNVPLMMLEGYEADDLLGTAAKKAERDGLTVSVISGDRDLLQLATDRIRIRIPKTKQGGTEVEDYNTAEVLEKYQVTPPQIVELKALMGDASDNIPGIPGVGEKTAAKIIAQYGSIENAYAHVEEIKPNRAKESLREHYDLAQLSKKLAKIDTDCPYTLDMEKAGAKDYFTREAYEFCRRLEFKNILPRFSDHTPERKWSEALHQVTELPEAEQLFAKAAKEETVGFSVLAEKESLLGLSLALGSGGVSYFPVQGFLTGTYLMEKLTDVLRGVKTACTIDLKPQLSHMGLSGELRPKIQDVSIGAYLLNPVKGQYPCEDIAKDYSEALIPGRAELLGKTSLAEAAGSLPDKFCEYAGSLAYTALSAWPAIRDRLKKDGMDRLYAEIELPLIYTLYDMEQAGVRVNAQELKEYGESLQGKIRELEQRIYAQAGEEFNINSPKQLGNILFGKMQLPGGKKTKSGYSTAADVLEKLAKDSPIVSDILEYRQLTKLKSTYADGLSAFISGDGRIHGTFNQTITATGRISSTDPNLQNIPIRTELGRLLRKVFIPEEGCVLIDADYSQIELRVLAALSGDESMVGAFRENADIHRLTASQVFHVPFEEVTPLQRRNAKAVNFGIVYGISSFGLSEDLHVSVKEAGDYIEKYFHTYPKIKEFLDRSVQEAKEKGYVLTKFGRRRPIPELHSANFVQRSFGERVAMNSPIQGTAADIIKIAMIAVNNRLRAEGLRARLILQVHDELLVEAPAEETEEVKKILSEEMVNAVRLDVPMEVDMKVGNNWYEAH